MPIIEQLLENASKYAKIVKEDPTDYTNQGRHMEMNSRINLLKRIPLEKLMDLKVDYAFKQLFGNEKNKEITVVFLNAILQRTGQDQIKDISFQNTESGGEYVDDKQSRLDLLVVTNAGEWINVEMQFTNKYNMVKRSIYYWSGVYRQPFKKNMAYKELRPVIAINILNFDLLQQTERFHTTYHLYEDEEKFRLTNVMEFHYIEMSKLIRDWKQDKLDPWNDVLARWLLLLGMVDHRNGEVYHEISKELEEIAMKDKSLHDALVNWKELSMSQEQYFAYESRLKYVLDEEAFHREMELLAEEIDRKKKEIEHKKQEIERKVKEVEHREKELISREKDTKEVIARRLLENGMDIDFVMETTELSKERVLEILNEME